MRELINYCHGYKLQFNVNKSISHSLKETLLSQFHMNGTYIPKSDGFIYLGLPIGNQAYIEYFFNGKMVKCEKYSLGTLGCHPNALNPTSIGFIFKQYCQSILKFGMENLYMKPSSIKLLNTRQNILLKNVIVIKYFARMSPLLTAIKVDQIRQIYIKHKFFKMSQFKKIMFL